MTTEIKIDEEILEHVITDGIRFLESMGRYYGSDRAMQIWESMGDAMGQEIKGQVFMYLLKGHDTGSVRFRCGDPDIGGKAVGVIRTVRQYTGMGLKDAKDAWDASKNRYVEVKPVSREDARILRRELQNLGCEIA